jgi:outer membrane protein assembly factor BamB
MVPTGQPGPIPEPSECSWLTALNSTTGKQLWSFAAYQRPGFERLGLGFSPRVKLGGGASAHMAYTTLQTAVSAVNIVTGKGAWTKAFKLPIRYTLLNSDKTLMYVLGFDTVFALHSSTGNITWSYQPDEGVELHQLAFEPGMKMLYLVYRDSTPLQEFTAIAALDAISGKVKWTHEIPNTPDTFFTVDKLAATTKNLVFTVNCGGEGLGGAVAAAGTTGAGTGKWPSQDFAMGSTAHFDWVDDDQVKDKRHSAYTFVLDAATGHVHSNIGGVKSAEKMLMAATKKGDLLFLIAHNKVLAYDLGASKLKWNTTLPDFSHEKQLGLSPDKQTVYVASIGCNITAVPLIAGRLRCAGDQLFMVDVATGALTRGAKGVWESLQNGMSMKQALQKFQLPKYYNTYAGTNAIQFSRDGRMVLWSDGKGIMAQTVSSPSTPAPTPKPQPTPAKPTPGFPTPSSKPTPGSIPTEYAEQLTVYREHPLGDVSIEERDSSDAAGALLFLLVDINATDGGPSKEGNPATDWITAFHMEFDRRYTGYSSCDIYDDSYKCLCKAERQPPLTPCNENAVGFVNLKPYYKPPPAGLGPAPSGCGWPNNNICQINLGQKLRLASSNFSWYSTPAKVKGSKWQVKSVGRSVRAWCVIDTIGTMLAPKCASHCKQNLPSKGQYNPCYSRCLFTQLLGEDWNEQVSKSPAAEGIPADRIVQAFESAMGSCPSNPPPAGA